MVARRRFSSLGNSQRRSALSRTNCKKEVLTVKNIKSIHYITLIKQRGSQPKNCLSTNCFETMKFRFRNMTWIYYITLYKVSLPMLSEEPCMFPLPLKEPVWAFSWVETAVHRGLDRETLCLIFLLGTTRHQTQDLQISNP